MYPSNMQGWTEDHPCIGFDTGVCAKTRKKLFNNGNIKILMNQTIVNLSDTTNL